MAKVVYSHIAISDLDEIGDYVMENTNNPDSALNAVSRIQDAIDNLIVFPEMGTQLSSMIEIETDYRFLVCGNYLAFYRISADNVYVDRILHGKRDYLPILLPGIF